MKQVKKTDNINVVIPMAGLGSRFVKAGYKDPKPFIDILGKSMIKRVLSNLYIKNATFILILQKDHLSSHQKELKNFAEKYPVKLIPINNITEGAACTVLRSVWLINNNTPLLIANSDQIVDMNICNFIDDSDKKDMDGSILTFEDNDPKWSYAKIDSNGFVTEIREKKVISKYATVGIYYFKQGKIFVNASTSMISNNDRINNEFYVAPAYNYAIEANYKFCHYNITKRLMHGLGTPKDLDKYLKYLNQKR